MQNRTERAANRPLYLLLALMGLGTMVNGFLEVKGGQGAAMLLSLLNSLLQSYAAFVWFCRDSDAHRYRRSLLRNIGFNAFGLVFVPYYLVRSRAPGQKWRALLRLCGFLFLMLTAAATGAMVISLIMAVV